MTLPDRIGRFLDSRNVPIQQALELLEEARDELRRLYGQGQQRAVGGDRQEDSKVSVLPAARQGEPGAKGQEVQASTQAGHDPKDDVNPPEGYEVRGG